VTINYSTAACLAFPNQAARRPFNGITNRARSNQASSSSGAASGLLAICAAMSSSVSASNHARFSGVAHSRAAASASSRVIRLIFSDFSVIGFPETYNPANRTTPRIYRNTDTITKSRDGSGRNKATFAILIPLVLLFDERAIEEKLRCAQRQSMLVQICRGLRIICFEHNYSAVI
jgi:hypothetical protein